MRRGQCIQSIDVSICLNHTIKVNPTPGLPTVVAMPFAATTLASSNPHNTDLGGDSLNNLHFLVGTTPTTRHITSSGQSTTSDTIE